MTNRTILVGMAATFVGLTALLVVAGIVVNPLLLAVAVPFGAVAYLLWYHASGKLRDRVRREAAAASATERERARQRARAANNRRDAYRTAGADAAGQGRGGATGRGGGRTWNGAGPGPEYGASGDPRDRAPRTDVMTEREAYETLGLDPTADGDAIRTAYRDRVKRVHPDGADGDEEAFKELTEAYEIIRG